LTGGIITARSGEQRLGHVLGWDPKETWSLITWFVYAILSSLRAMCALEGDPDGGSYRAVGFLAVIFTYLGVNLVLSVSHSYAV